MTNHQEILDSLRMKERTNTFGNSEVEELLSLVKNDPCDLSVRLTLLELAQILDKTFPQSWTYYYQQTLEIAEHCWDVNEIAQIYRLGALLHSYDQNIGAQVEAATKALELTPNDWKSISSYLWYNRKIPQKTAIPLIESLSRVDSDNPVAHYLQGRHFEMYGNRYNKKKYKEAAVKAFQKALDLGLDEGKHGYSPLSAEDAIQRLKDELKIN